MSNYGIVIIHIEISIHDVFQSLAKLDVSKAMAGGIDGFPNFVYILLTLSHHTVPTLF